MDGTATTNQYTGRMLPTLVAASDKARGSAVEEFDPWTILTNARNHLCAHVMTAGDVKAWFLIGDVQEQTIIEELRRLFVLR